MSECEINDQENRPQISDTKNFFAYAAQHHIPISGTFELTPRCSLRCKMCYVRLEKKQMDAIGCELTAQEWISLGRDAAKAGTLDLLITGGEPMLRDDFEKIYTALSEMGFLITLYTNATLMTPERFKLLTKYPPRMTCVTLYGANAETYEKVCGDASGFEKTIRGLELLSKAPGKLSVRATFIRDNMQELNDLADIAHRFSSRLLLSGEIYKSVRGATADVEGCRMTRGQTIQLNEAHQRLYPRSQSDGEELSEILAAVPPVTIPCAAGKYGYFISWDGKMFPCGIFETPYTHPFQEGFLPAWNRLSRLIENIAEPEGCASCEMKAECNKCPARLQTETGSFDEISPYICLKMANK